MIVFESNRWLLKYFDPSTVELQCRQWLREHVSKLVESGKRNDVDFYSLKLLAYVMILYTDVLSSVMKDRFVHHQDGSFAIAEE